MADTNNDASSQYARAGVDIDAGQRTVEMLKSAVLATYTPQVLSEIGNFGGLFDISALKAMQAPVLVASTDGVGTKTMVAAHMNRWDTIGQDLVNHCLNDILVQGARPLFFMDYVATSRLVPEQIAAIVGGMAKACEQAGCALLGGETAEMPGVYVDGEVDVVGTILGVVDRAALIDGQRIQPGDVMLGLPSSGLHTNGYSLARLALADLDWHTVHPALGQPIGEALLAIHRAYVADVQAMQGAGLDIRGLAHITGGGIVDNLPRILPDHVDAIVRRGSWPVPPIFDLIQQQGNVTEGEMLRVFNMGLGMLAVLPAKDAKQVDGAYVVGEIVAGQGAVVIEDAH
jgi:phosphoribosylformylglycinamidine cyclo-ligase